MKLNVQETFEMLTAAFSESTMSRTQVQLWYKRFKEGRENENIEAVKKLSLDNRQITIREVADDVGISFGLCRAIFMNVFGMKHASTKIVPKLLNF